MTLFAFLKAKSDIVTLLAARGLRTFGDGFGVIILPVYLSALGLSTFQIGLAASASLLGTAALTLSIGFIAPRYELRHLFLAGAGLIAFTGLAFPMAETVVPIVIVSFIGSINASAGDIGMMIPLEHSLLPIMQPCSRCSGPPNRPRKCNRIGREPHWMTVIRRCLQRRRRSNPDPWFHPCPSRKRVLNTHRSGPRINFGTQFANPLMLSAMKRFGLELDWAVAAALLVACSLNGALLYGLL